MSSAPAVELAGVTKRFGRGSDRALADVNLSIAPTEFVAIEGPSGSGKSTLLHLVAALDRPDRGRIVVGDRDLRHRHGLDRYRRRTVGIVFQLHNLLPHLTAKQNVTVATYGTHRSRHTRSRAAVELLEQLDCAHLADQFPPQLSGGERQRIAIARALVNNPTLILADEPTGSLDPRGIDMVAEVLERRRQQGATLLVVTHDARLSSRADRVLRLVAGHLDETPSTATHGGDTGR